MVFSFLVEEIVVSKEILQVVIVVRKQTKTVVSSLTFGMTFENNSSQTCCT